jgi:hypothetical protein
MVENKHKFFTNIDSHLELTFKGVSTFRNQVVYADLIKDAHFEKLISLQSSSIIIKIIRIKTSY